MSMKSKNLEVGAPSESEQIYHNRPGILLVFILVVVERKAPKQRMSILSCGCLAELGYSVTIPVQGNLHTSTSLNKNHQLNSTRASRTETIGFWKAATELY